MSNQIMSEPVEPPRKRRRPALSCVECRRRKIKCDRNDPCTQCTMAKSVTCTYKDGYPGRGAKPASSALSSAQDLAGSETVTSSADSNDTGSNGPFSRIVPLFDDSHSNSTTLYSPSASVGSQKEEASNNDVDVLLKRVKKLEETLNTVSQSNHAPAWSSLSGKDDSTFFGQASRNPVPELRGSVSKTRLFGQSHWMSAFEHFRHLSSFRLQSGIECSHPVDLSHHEIKTSEIRTLLEKCKTMARAAKAERPTQWHVNPNFADYIPPRDLSDKLVHLYRRTFESTYRILHLPTFEREYEEYWKDPSSACPGSLVKIVLVMAIGSMFYQGPDFHAVRESAQQWVYAAQSWISAPFEKGRLNISGLQIHCLVLLARQTTAVGGDLVWISAGSLLRMAITMGFHRDPSLFPKMSVLHAELRRRLWATVLEITVSSSFDSGNPPLILADSWDTAPPSNFNDCQIDEHTKVAPAAHPDDTYTQSSLQIQLLKSIRTRLEIAHLISDFRTHPSYDEIIRLGKSITSFARSGALLGQQAQNWDLKPTSFQRNLLDTPLRRTLLALHFPYAMKARENPHLYYSRKVCLDTAITIITYPSTSSPLHPSPLAEEGQDDYTRLKLVGGGFFKETLIYAAIIVQLELITQLEDEAPLPRDELARKSRQPLEDYIRYMICLSAKRVMLGENNIKGHLFLSAVCAQIEAMERGIDPDPLIAKAAKGSAETCYGLLKARIKKPPRSLVDELDAGEESTGSQGNGGIEMQFGSMDMEQGFDFEYLMPDASMNFDIPESWLFEGWEEHHEW